MSGGTRNTRSNKKAGNDTNINTRILEMEANIGNQLEAFKEELSNIRKDDITPENSNKIDLLIQKFTKFEILVKEGLENIKKQVEDCVIQADNNLQRQYKNKLIIHGVEEADNENLILFLVNMLNNKLDLKEEFLLKVSDISDCYRYGTKKDNKTRPIVVEFIHIWKRRGVFYKKTLFKGSNYVISEFLTPLRHILYRNVKNQFKKECWTKDGEIVFIWQKKKYSVSTLHKYHKIIGNND